MTDPSKTVLTRMKVALKSVHRMWGLQLDNCSAVYRHHELQFCVTIREPPCVTGVCCFTSSGCFSPRFSQMCLGQMQENARDWVICSKQGICWLIVLEGYICQNIKVYCHPLSSYPLLFSLCGIYFPYLSCSYWEIQKSDLQASDVTMNETPQNAFANETLLWLAYDYAY